MKLIKVLWGIIGIIALIWIYYIYISPLIFKPNEVEIPNVEGMTEQDAKASLDSYEIKYNVNYIDGKSNTVKYTYPSCGTKIYLSYTIDVFIEKSLPSFYQSFIGLIYDENIDLIVNYCESHNISFKVIYEVNNDYTSGQIFKQSKSNNDVVKENDELVLFVAKSDEFIAMPNLVGMHIDECIRILNGYKLTYNIIYYNTPIDEDIVISQSVNEGTLIKKGNVYSFDIYVSKGMPFDLSSLNIDQFLNVLSEINYNYDIIYVDSIIDDKLIKIEDNILYISK